MSKAKITRISPPEQAPRSIPLADVRLTWTAQDYWGDTAKTRTIDGATLARLLYAVPSSPRDEDNGWYLDLHLDALRHLTSRLSESETTDSAPKIFWALSQYLAWLRLEEQGGDAIILKKLLASATVTLGTTAEEAPA